MAVGMIADQVAILVDLFYNFRIGLHILPGDEKGGFRPSFLQPFQKLLRIIGVGAVVKGKGNLFGIPQFQLLSHHRKPFLLKKADQTYKSQQKKKYGAGDDSFFQIHDKHSFKSTYSIYMRSLCRHSPDKAFPRRFPLSHKLIAFLLIRISDALELIL